MQIIYLDENVQFNKEKIVSAIGFFDGLHLGHMKLVDEVIHIANKKGYKKALMTFDHHPLYVLGKIDTEYHITSMDDRIHLLEEKGIDYLFIICFTKEVSQTSYKDFIKRYLLNLHIVHVVCGFDFHFGSKNEGDCFKLKDHDPSLLQVSIIDEVLYQEKKVSSTRLREAIEEGNMELTTILLGRHYTIHGEVIEGRKIGRQLGFPTANIDYSSYLLPKRGVYAVYVFINHKKYLGMCNIGYNPTVGILPQKSVEVNIFDFDEDIYGIDISLSFLKMIRGEWHFQTKEELIRQLNKDKKSIKDNF